MKPIDFATTPFAAHPPSLNKLLLIRCNLVLAASGHPASFTSLQAALDSLASIGISEITSDFAAGRQPWDAPDFSALHKHTDANCYALLADDQWACDVDDDKAVFVQLRFGIADYVQEIMAQWMLATLELRQAVADHQPAPTSDPDVKYWVITGRLPDGDDESGTYGPCTEQQANEQFTAFIAQAYEDDASELIIHLVASSETPITNHE